MKTGLPIFLLAVCAGVIFSFGVIFGQIQEAELYNYVQNLKNLSLVQEDWPGMERIRYENPKFPEPYEIYFVQGPIQIRDKYFIRISTEFDSCKGEWLIELVGKWPHKTHLKN